MIANTINDAQTIAGNGEGPLLAGRYRVVRQLGRGGMGSVWLAEDVQLDGKPFAIKMLPAILVANRRAYRQLKDEALVAMRLVHPNVVQIRAFEENGGNPFLVMDYVDGRTLDDYLAEKGALAPEAVLRILRPVAAALDYAHGEGVVHRDVKPANVMIRVDGHPFILDFGIAREIQETLTRVTGKLSSGTLLYMSPEQLNGEPPKKAQDVYSFAAMAYECLKGEPPFVRGQIEHQILNNPPPPLAASGGGGPAGTAANLAAGVMAGLAKKPQDRPKSCIDVLSGRLGRAEQVESRRRVAPAIPKPAAPMPPPRPRMELPVQEKGNRRVMFVSGLILAMICIVAGVCYNSRQARLKEERARRMMEARLADERKRAEETKIDAELARVQAEKLDAKTHAYALWVGAETFMQQASEAFGRGEYTLASTNFANAASSYRLGAERAEKRRLEIARAEQRRKLEDDKAREAAERIAAERQAKVAAEAREKEKADARKAITVRDSVRKEWQSAEEAGAKIHAAREWNDAVAVWNRATDEFTRQEFTLAEQSFAEAARRFRSCGELAKRRKGVDARMQREEERRKAVALRRDLSTPGSDDLDRLLHELGEDTSIELVERPANMNFCRHCGTVLTGRKIRRKCGNCGKNLFGE